MNAIMDGGDQIASFLSSRGVKFLFTLCGGHISPILVACKNAGIRVIDVRNEATAVFAADAISRLTGIPGVAAVTAGPGVTNTITAIKNAQMAQSPLILLGGAVATVLRGRGALQDIDQISIVKSIVKYAARIETDCDIEVTLDKAFEKAVSGVPGPVFIECPIDVLYDQSIVRQNYFNKAHQNQNKSLTDSITDWYLEYHIEGIFACDIPESQLEQEENQISELTQESLNSLRIQRDNLRKRIKQSLLIRKN